MWKTIIKQWVQQIISWTVRLDNLAADLTDYDWVDFVMVSDDWTIQINNVLAEFWDKTKWEVFFSPSATDFNTIWKYNAYFVIKQGTVKRLTAPEKYIEIDIIDDLI